MANSFHFELLYANLNSFITHHKDLNCDIIVIDLGLSIEDKTKLLLLKEDINFRLPNYDNWNNYANIPFNKTCQINGITYPDANAIAKIEIFNYTEYTNIVFCDSDTIFLHNCSELFESQNNKIIRYEDGHYNAGVIVLNDMLRINKTYHFIISKMFLMRKNRREETVLELINETSELELQYNFSDLLEIYNSQYIFNTKINRNVKIIHYLASSCKNLEKIYDDKYFRQYCFDKDKWDKRKCN